MSEDEEMNIDEGLRVNSQMRPLTDYHPQAP